MRLYGALLEAGVELLEYNRTMMHHKIMMVDGLWSTVGTSNFDNRSFSHNEENNVCVCDAKLARQLNDMFERDAEHCECHHARGVEVAAAARQDGPGPGLVLPGSGLAQGGPRARQPRVGA